MKGYVTDPQHFNKEKFISNVLLIFWNLTHWLDEKLREAER